MPAIPEQIVERVRSESHIVDVISDYVRLRRSGKNWVGLCPFHDDKKPSFSVEPIRGIFKCFSCGEGGNVFTFLMKKNGWTFPETVRSLAVELGIEIPENGAQSDEMSETERLVSALRESARRYHSELYTDRSEHALAYFRGRGFSDETIKKFGLGFAPESWDWLLKELTAGGYTPDELVKAGLIIERRKGEGHYDRFRGRALFPIFEGNGRLVGFGARRMGEDEDQPKYINSPDSRVYHKSRVLYGLYQAKDSIRKEGHALFVEGYADVVSLHQGGITTAIAPCGTAIAPEHAKLIARFTNRVVLIFDSDSAGERATEKGIATLIAGGLEVAVVRLPDGEDPDSFLRSRGSEHFRERIGEARPFIEYLAHLFKTRGELDDPEKSARAIRKLVETIAQIPDRLRRELYINRLALDYHLSESLMVQELERATGVHRKNRERARRYAQPPADQHDHPIPDSADPGEQVSEENRSEEHLPPAIPSDATAFPPAELKLVQVLAAGDTMLLKETFERIDESDFSHPLLRQFVNLILAHYMNHAEFALEDLSLEDLSDAMRRFVTTLVVEKESISDFWEENDPDYRKPNSWKAARDCLISMQLQKLAREEERVSSALRAEELGDDEALTLLREMDQLGHRRVELQVLLRGEEYGGN